MSNKEMNSLIDQLFHTDQLPADKTSAEIWLEKLASEGMSANEGNVTNEKVSDKSETSTEKTANVKPNLEEKSMDNVTRKDLEALSLEQLIELSQGLLGETEEKTAETGEMTAEQAQEILASASAEELAELKSILEGAEKTAETSDEYEEIDTDSITGTELLKGLNDGTIILPDMEKEAEAETVELTEEQQNMYELGKVLAAGYTDGMFEINSAIEKQAEESQKEQLIDAIAGLIEKDASRFNPMTGKTNRVMELVDRLSSFAGKAKAGAGRAGRSAGRSASSAASTFGTYVKAPVTRSGMSEALGAANKGSKHVNRELAKSYGAKAAVGAAGAGTAAGGVALSRKKKD